MALILDTGPLVALVDRSSPDHERCRELIQGAGEARIVPLWSTCPTPQSWHAPPRWVDEYAHLALGLVEATVVACVERLRETKLATLDRRNFRVVRPRHVTYLELLPD